MSKNDVRVLDELREKRDQALGEIKSNTVYLKERYTVANIKRDVAGNLRNGALDMRDDALDTLKDNKAIIGGVIGGAIAVGSLYAARKPIAAFLAPYFDRILGLKHKLGMQNDDTDVDYGW